MNTETMTALLNRLRLNPIHTNETPAKEACFSPVPETLDARLAALVNQEFPSGLYRHQAEALEQALAGRNVILSTGTASGKTLSFALPAFQMILQDPQARAVFFYPTKALAGDQLKKFERYAQLLGLEDAVARFDGDVKSQDRPAVLLRARILLCTPDIVHFTMLRDADKRLYKDVFRNLRMIIMDESHVYSGAFGSNMAFLLRRLRQVCRKHGNELQFVCASATSRDPVAHMRQLTGMEFNCIGADLDGSPSGGRCFYMLDAAADAADRMQSLVETLVRAGTRFIVFSETRSGAEQNYIDLVNRNPALEEYVRPYRSGYEVSDRVEIEHALQENRLLGVISTSALELGVDLPDMDVCVLMGLPNTVMSFWQRAGRVGRKPGGIGQVLTLLGTSSLDDYYRMHPAAYFQKPFEELVVRLDNWPLIASHYACARFENRFFKDTDLGVDIFGADFVSLRQKIENGEILDDMLDNTLNPHDGLQLRGIGDLSFKILLNEQGEPLGSINWSQILREAYPEAIYRHMGRTYRVQKIKRKDREVIVRPEENRNLKTSPMGYLRVAPGQNHARVYRTTRWGELLELWHAEVDVAFYTSGFREKNGETFIRSKTFEPPMGPLRNQINTEGVYLRLQPALMTRLEKAAGLKALNTLAHAMANLYLINQPCGLTDIATHSTASHSDGCGYIFIFDTTSGGMGFSERVFDSFESLLADAARLLDEGGCIHCDSETERSDKGCPACIQIPRWIEDNENLSKSEALKLLTLLQEVIQTEPERTMERETYRLRRQGGMTSIQRDVERTLVEVLPEAVEEKDVPALLYAVGSRLRMRNGQMVRVLMHELDGGQEGAWLYHVENEAGKRLRIRDMGLELVVGGRCRMCGVCGNACGVMDEVCGECGEQMGV